MKVVLSPLSQNCCHARQLLLALACSLHSVGIPVDACGGALIVTKAEPYKACGTSDGSCPHFDFGIGFGIMESTLPVLGELSASYRTDQAGGGVIFERVET